MEESAAARTRARVDRAIHLLTTMQMMNTSSTEVMP